MPLQSLTRLQAHDAGIVRIGPLTPKRVVDELLGLSMGIGLLLEEEAEQSKR